MFVRAAVIIVLGFIAFGSMLHAPFRVMDDRVSIIDNPNIKSVKNILKNFKEGYFHDQSYYRPLINLSFMFEYQIFGANPFFYNLDDLILHVINALLVLLLVSRLTNSDTIGFWTGLLFVLHPVHWEAVCNIPGRSILLSSFFVLSSFILFLEIYKYRRWSYLIFVLLTFFAGLLCKESTGVFPVVILAYFMADKTVPWVEKFKSLWPLVVGIAAYIFLRQFFGITNIHPTSQPEVLVLGFVTFLRSVITDLRLFVLPLDLHYDRCLPFMLSMFEPQAIMTSLFWTAATVILIFYHRKVHPFFLFLMAWFFIELFPVSQLVSSIGVGAGHISTAEHFLYLASIPVLIGIVMAFRWVYEINVQKGYVSPLLLKFLAAGFMVFLLLTAVEQSIYASNEFNMLKRSLAFEPNNPRVQGTMAMLSVFRNDIPDAQRHFQLAINAEPSNPTYHISLGTALCQQGQWIEGLEQYVIFDPGKDKALVERQEKLIMAHILEQLRQGKAYDARGWLAIGIYYVKSGQIGQALDAFLKSVQLNPNQTDAWFNLGSLYEAQHHWPEARVAYKKLLELHDLTFFQRVFAIDHLAKMGKD